MKVTWLGHAAFLFEHDGKSVVIDPFITDNPAFPEKYKGITVGVNYLLLTHIHFDHMGDAVTLSKKTGKVVAIFEICKWLETKGITNYEPMNIGGTIELDDLVVHMVMAHHSSGFIEDGSIVYGGNPCGYVIEFGGHTLYHAGDTGLFLDMQLIQRLFSPDICMLPIGDRFTMGPREASIACNEFLDARTIIPMHFDTFPALTGKSDEFRKLVKRGTVEVLEPGGSLEV
ncbi:MAG: metal-dependent hydrolase [Candidatus Sulfobium sp.]|jgi:L-ascorbate metabolism protein UlaG (beta-lactamase superfamily)